jgi:hypothetical protein
LGTWAAYVSINASCNKMDEVTHRYGRDVICAKKNSLFRMLKGLPPSWVGEPIQPVAACGDDKPTTRLWALCNLQNRLSHVVTEQDSRSRGSKVCGVSGSNRQELAYWRGPPAMPFVELFSNTGRTIKMSCGWREAGSEMESGAFSLLWIV